MSDFYNDRMEFFRETGAKQAPSAGEGDAGNGGNEEIFDRGLLQDNSAADTAETFNHSLVTDNFNTVFAGRVMGYETPGTATNQSAIKLGNG